MEKRTRAVLVGVLVAATLAAGGLPAEAGKKRARKVTVSYTGPACLYVNEVCSGVLGGPFVSRAKDENRVSIEIIDSSGQMVGATIGEGAGGGPGFVVCGRTEKPAKLTPTGELYVNPFVGSCEQEVSLPTTGKIVLTFFRD